MQNTKQSVSTFSEDPLQNALITIARLHGVSININSAMNGLPLSNGKLTPRLFIRAAERSGMKANIVKRSWKKIPDALLPIILLGKDDEVYILTKKGKSKSTVIFSELGDASETVSTRKLKNNYSGFAIILKPEHQFDTRADYSEDEVKRPKSWFWGTLWAFRGFYFRVGMASAVINIFALASSLFVMNVYDRVVPNQAHETLFVLGAGALFAYILEFCLKSLRTFMVDRAGYRADLIMGANLFEQLLAMKFSCRPGSEGTLASQARSYEGLREFFTSATLAALVDLPFVFFFAFIVYCLGGIVAIPIIVGTVLVIFISLLVQVPMGRAVKEAYQSTNQRHAMVIESLNALETVKSTRAESTLQRKMEDCIHTSAKAEGVSRWYSQIAVNSTAFIQNLVSMAIIFIAFYQVLNGHMTMGQMIACVILAGRGMAPLATLASLLSRLQQSRRSLIALNEIMKLPREHEDSEKKISIREFKPSIKAADLSFAYPCAATIPVLSNVDLKIEPGEQVGILGSNGSGKSTLMRILLGLYEPSGGRVDVSQHDIRQITPADLRENIAYLPQDCQLLYGTIRENILVGQPWADDEDIWQVLELAGIADFIQAHPEGLDLRISEGGKSMSGGQRQAVCLARALMGTPQLLLFDEPTAALDYRSEKQLIQQIRDYVTQNNSTLILSTHKSGLLELVDRVIILEGGKIVADGPRDVVLKKPTPKRNTSPTQQHSTSRSSQVLITQN